MEELSDHLELAVVEHTETGLYYGAVYRNHPTPSGCDRWLLAITMNAGFASVRKATVAVNAAFPECKPLELPDEEEEVSEMDVVLPAGALVTHMIPNKNRLGPSESQIIEVQQYNASDAPLLNIPITPRQLQWLRRAGHVVHDCSSGDDPGLNYRYEHYVVPHRIEVPGF